MTPYYAEYVDCGHCYSTRELETLVSHEFDRKTYEDERNVIPYEWWSVVSVLRCQDCAQLTLMTYPWSDMSDPEDEVPIKVVYPPSFEASDLPVAVANAYKNALRAQKISSSFYAVGIRMTLEVICDDASVVRTRPNRQGRQSPVRLVDRIAQLAEGAGLPPSLVSMAHHLRVLGNIGAHGAELDEDSLSAASQLTESLLDYLYRTPAILTRSMARLTRPEEDAE